MHKCLNLCNWLICPMLLVAQSYPTLCDAMECSPPGSSDHGILQARILELVAIPFSRRSPYPRDWNQISCIAGRFFTIWATREALVKRSHVNWLMCPIKLLNVFLNEFFHFVLNHWTCFIKVFNNWNTTKTRASENISFFKV